MERKKRATQRRYGAFYLEGTIRLHQSEHQLYSSFFGCSFRPKDVRRQLGVNQAPKRMDSYTHTHGYEAPGICLRIPDSCSSTQE